MPRESSITKLPKEIREQLDQLLGAGATVDELTEYLQGFDIDMSRSAVGRYRKKIMDSRKHIQESIPVAKIFAKDITDKEQTQQSQYLIKIARTLAFETSMCLAGKEVTPKTLSFLTKSIKDLETAATISVERELKIRKDVASQAAEAADKVIKETKGITKETADKIRRHILGVAEQS